MQVGEERDEGTGGVAVGAETVEDGGFEARFGGDGGVDVLLQAEPNEFSGHFNGNRILRREQTHQRVGVTSEPVEHGLGGRGLELLREIGGTVLGDLDVQSRLGALGTAKAAGVELLTERSDVGLK